MNRILAATRALAPLLGALFVSAPVSAAEKPLISYKAPPSGDDDRPLITEIIFTPQGSDYAFKIEFNKEPSGDSCRTRCANATIFVDTDNNRGTGLKLNDPKAVETGADLAIVIQTVREVKEGGAQSTLKVKVLQFSEDSTSIDQSSTLTELDPAADPERLLAEGTSVYLLIDTNVGNVPTGQKARLIYHPPDSKALVGIGKGLTAAGVGHIELFKGGKLQNPPKKKKSDYEKL
jgi:hypothetical protein